MGAAPTHRRPAAAAVICLLAALASACHVQTRIALPGASPQAVAGPVVKAGDNVVIELKDGTLAGCVVAEVQPDAIIGTRGQRYPTAEIVRIERRRVSLVRSAGLVAGLYAGLVAALTLMLLAAGAELA